MEDELYKKIGKQEMMLEALKGQNAELSKLVARFVSGEEKPDDWAVTPQGQLHKKSEAPSQPKASKK